MARGLGAQEAGPVLGEGVRPVPWEFWLPPFGSPVVERGRGLRRATFSSRSVSPPQAGGWGVGRLRSRGPGVS